VKYLSEQFTLPFMTIIHYMSQGSAVCGLGQPHEWGPDHRFATEWDDVTCDDCKAQRTLLESPMERIEVKTRPPEVTKEHVKKTPAYKDTDLMPFGKYNGKQLKYVPANYLHWLWTKRPLTNVRLENYIFNSIEALRKEYQDGIWT